LIRANRATPKLAAVREYFLLFDRAALLEKILGDELGSDCGAL